MANTLAERRFAAVRLGRATELSALAVILAVSAFLRLHALDYGQFRSDDVALWNIVRDFIRDPRVISAAMPSSLGINNGPMQAYLLVPGVLIGGAIGAYASVALLNVASVLLFWGFVRSYFDRRLALLAGLLYGVNPWAVVFSRRLWGEDMLAPFSVLLVWALCDLVRYRRRRDHLFPFLWLSVLMQTYVVALVDVVLLAFGLALAWRRLRPFYTLLGVGLFALASSPYLYRVVAPGIGDMARTLGAEGVTSTTDLSSLRFMFHVVSSEGYQAFANQAGTILDASSGLPMFASLVSSLLLAAGLVVTGVSIASAARSNDAERVMAFTLPMLAILMPVVLLIRHEQPVYPYYLATGFPMYFLLMALGIRWIWRASSGISTRPALCEIGHLVVRTVVGLGVACNLALAAVFFVAIQGYWGNSDYGLPLRHAFRVADAVKQAADIESIRDVYVAGPEEPDSVITRALRPDLPDVRRFRSSDSFLWPDANAGKVLYALASENDRVGRAFSENLNANVVDSISIPGSGLEYTLYVARAPELESLLGIPSGTLVGAVFDKRVRLDSYSFEPELRPGEPHDVMLRWTLLADKPGLASPYQLSVQLSDSSQQATAVADLVFYDMGQWRQGEHFISWHRFPTPQDVKSGAYSYLLGLYVATGPQSYFNLPVVDAKGALLRDGLRLGTAAVRANAKRPPGTSVDTAFGPSIVLEGYDLAMDRSAGKLDLALWWRAQNKVDGDYKVFVHLLGRDGAVAAQHDSPPMNGRYPTGAWLVGDTIADRHTILVPVGMGSGRYEVEIGMYREDTGERLGGRDFAINVPVNIE